MRRTTLGLMLTLPFAILAVPRPSLAQPPAKVPRIGFLWLGAASGNQSLLDGEGEAKMPLVFPIRRRHLSGGYAYSVGGPAGVSHQSRYRLVKRRCGL